MEISVTYGKVRKRPDPHKTYSKRWTLMVDGIILVDGKPIYEREKLRNETRPEDTVRPELTAEDALKQKEKPQWQPNYLVDPKQEISLHREVYDLPVGTMLTLRLDRSDDRGRFTRFPMDVICEVVAEGGIKVGDHWSAITGVKPRKREYPQSKFIDDLFAL
jgi:hypothetical protein